MKRSVSHSPSVQRPAVSTTKTLMTLTETWLNWEEDSVVENNKNVRMISPGLPKKAKLKDGQVTLTQLTVDEEKQATASPVCFSVASSNGSSEETLIGSPPNAKSNEDTVTGSSLVATKAKKRPHHVVDNDTIVLLLKELQESLVVLMEQIETANSWFGEKAFDQRKWIEDELSIAIEAVQECPAYVSVMGRRDMQRFLPDTVSENTYVLLKHLSVNHGFKIHVDIDLNSVHAMFKLQHHRDNFRTLLYEYGKGSYVDGSVFDE